jgi:hypothetical protein
MTANSMREKGIEPLRPTRAADPKSTPRPGNDALPPSDHSTAVHGDTPDIAAHATVHVTRRKPVARDPEKSAVFHREWRNGVGREKYAAAIKRYQQRNPEKRRAHWAVDNALRSGKLVKGPCEVGGGCAGRIEAHHDDYARPLEVRWVCKRHHRGLDLARQGGAA